MAPRRQRRFLEFFLLFPIVGVLFGMLVIKYYEISATDARRAGNSMQNALVIGAAQAGFIDPCGGESEMTVFSPTVYICNEEESNDAVYHEIYSSYPVTADGREIVYSFLDEGEKRVADQMLEDTYAVERYDPVTLAMPLTWTENPYDERYWRFIFYSLRPLRHLLATAEETHAERYYEKTREITESFIDRGMGQEYAWDDAHAVAFRTMVLVNVWWKLREAGELPAPLSDKILAALEAHGNFLLSPENYEDDYNHAITQSAALLLLANAFPDIANAEAWRESAIRRLNVGLSSIIDANGVLVENSPFYHFYVLEKYWEIKEYAKLHSIEISSEFEETVNQMIGFATYVLRPDSSVPLLGASNPRSFVPSGIYRAIADENPAFRYALTRGEEGEVPDETNVLYPSSGIALFRSGWGTDRPYTDEMHLLFDTGPYRTDHSDLDALTFSLYGNGTPIINDTGLFTYETEHTYYDYFHGTRGHNTIMVDDSSQLPESAQHREIEEGDGYAYLAAWHNLYSGVRHSRTIVLLEQNMVLVLDAVASDEPHMYEQLFHLPPSARIDTPASAEHVRGAVETGGAAVPFHIEQIGDTGELSYWRGEDDPIRGYCATGYEVREPCYELSYRASSTEASFLTLIQFGEEDARFTATYDREESVVTLTSPETTYRIDVTFPTEGLLDASYIDVAIEIDGVDTSSLFEKAGDYMRSIF